MLKVLLTGGGTGGHVNPALAIADIIKQNRPEAEFLYIGTKNGMENRLVSKENYEIRHVEARGFQRSLSPKNIPALWYFLTSPARAKKIIREFKPDIVIGTGGYVCYAPLKAAAALGIPTLIHESNALPGLAVRLLKGKMDRILLNFAESQKYIEDARNKTVVVGNPVRNAFGKYDRESARAALGIGNEVKHVLLSYGGSLGAPAINSAAMAIMKEYDAKHPEIIHIHATGRNKYDEFIKQFEAAGLDKYKNIQVSDYLYDMPQKLAAADLVISRAGAMTVTETARMKKASIMIPSPYVADNHQYKNAKVLADAGAAVLLEEKDLNGDAIIKEVSELLNDPNKRASMSENIAAFFEKDTDKLIYGEIEKLIKKA